MASRDSPAVPPVLCLAAETAAALMTTNPVSLRDVATIQEAITLLTNNGFSAAPVIDAAGHPIGVLSRSDILAHERERGAAKPSVAHAPVPAGLGLGPAEAIAPESPQAPAEDIRVRDLMTPVVFSVAPETPAHRVVEEMLALHVHRLFVVDRDGVLIGVISALDVLRHLRPL